jgi:predicted enzyme related to lactoylglutathione lyase
LNLLGENTMTLNNNVVGWFEIPVMNMERAIQFYETVFDFKLTRHHIGPPDMAWFPWVETGLDASGSLVQKEDINKPSMYGVLLYFTAYSGDLSIEVARVKDAGGKVLLPKTLISDDIGYMAIIVDSEGNRIAIHSRR